ncbi:MAG: tetratricopeptide repeat protein [Caldilinea sp.]|nr:tetratricopeptide repeat protein [Caldilineaceae bacterium]MCW5839905.1 tetratricopeptide repeat protein [Caldilinea sp.]
MPEPILATKLYIPPPALRLAPRPRLVERLAAGTRRRLTLIAAPAGFGKTTLVSSWVAGIEAGEGPRVAWLALEREESDLARFFTYVVAALRTVAPGAGAGVLEMLQSGRPSAPQALAAALVNDLAALPGEIVLVLDDLHAVESAAVDEALAFLLDHQPPQLHLVVTTRSDPHLPLARLRARDQLAEIRAADLRFTLAEASDFLTRAMRLELPPASIAALEARTEGWIAGLQLAALSMEGRRAEGAGGMAAFVDSFTGSHRFVLDYLVEEVLNQQPAAMQRFLLRTSILERLCGPLCDAVVRDAATPGQATLEAIERANLFIVPLDNERRWYRYHHLFADLLRQSLAQTADLDENEAHRRASAWLEANGLALEAFHHAVAANDTARAAQLVAGQGMPLYLQGAAAPVLDWLATLPRAELDAQPALWVMWASALTMSGAQSSTIEEKLAAAEATLSGVAAGEEPRDLAGQIAAIRAMLAVPLNDVETIIAQAQQARALLRADNLPMRTTTAWSLGYAYQIRGERAAAGLAYAEAIDVAQASGNLMVELGATTCLGQIREAEGDLHEAEGQYRRVLEMVGDPPWPVACEAYLGLARLHYQWNELETAQSFGERSLELALEMQNVDTPAACGIFLARLHLARGDAQAATAALAQAEAIARRHGFEHQMGALVAMRVRILLRQGQMAEAAHLLAAAGDDASSRARVLLAQGDAAAALAAIEPWRDEAERRQWADERLAALVLQAVAHEAAGATVEAVQVLGEALSAGEAGGHVRVFVDEGEPMVRLLREVAAEGRHASYAHRLLAALGAGAARSASPQPLVEPLSERELEVLRLLATELSGPEIARKLHVSLNTLRTHTKNIYSKLDANSRLGAVHRAEALGLL